ncbi:MAG TPA: hypothetical protein PKI71_14720, partial [Candidatus Rifleibacterium sp.]|nr:hypothetical protein [Candidatus Rifleibacterium sp.]
MIEQSFTTPAGQVNASVYFDYERIRSGTPDQYLLRSQILDTTSGASPNESVFFTVFDEPFTNNDYAFGSLLNTGWSTPVTLVAGRLYNVRVLVDVTCAGTEIAGAFVDNVMCNISPWGLNATLNGSANELSWAASTGQATLHGTTPYKVYRSTTSGSYLAAPFDSTTNSYTDSTPPAGAIVYYTVTDYDSNDIESPKSVELPVLRMTVNDGAGADVDTIAGDDVTMNWVNNVGAVGPTGYEVALGTSPGASDIVGWTAVAVGATSYTFTGQTLTNGTTYYCSIRVITATRTLNSSSSDGFVCVKTTVRDGSGVDVDVTSSLSDADMNWDALTIPVLRYEVAVGTTPGGTEVAGWINAGAATSYSFTGLSLTNGSTYYCSVRAIDMSSSVIGVFTSDGFSPLFDNPFDVY